MMQKIFDSHVHIIDPQFELVENNGFLPDHYTVENYLSELKELGLEASGGAVVSGSFQGFHQDYFADALGKLGKGFVGVIQLPFDTTDEELKKLHEIGIRGIRFNLFRGFDATLAEIKELSLRVYQLHGWKTEFYINLAETSKKLKQLILDLPAASIDHLGMTQVPFEELEDYLRKDIPIRLTGFGRIDYSREEAANLIRKIYDANPKCLVFGTDLPSTRARYRFSKQDVALIREVLTEEESDNVFYQNGYNWYLN